MTSQPSQNKYDSSSIRVLKGLDAVKKRPGMYIGDTGNGDGLHHMIFEVMDNSIDEALAGHCQKIEVTIHTDNSVSVRDDGRGIPVDMHEEGVSAAEIVMTKLHAGGKFDNNIYKVSGGLHGVGLSVVNALSGKLLLEISRDGKKYSQEYAAGEPLAALKEIQGSGDTSGTFIRFYPEEKVFGNTLFDAKRLQERMLYLSYLNSGIYMELSDERDGSHKVFHSEGGLLEYVHHLRGNKGEIARAFHVEKEEDKTQVEIALQWCDSFQEKILCFTNNIPQSDGGTHLEGLRGSLTRVIKNYIEKEMQKDASQIMPEDVREGLIAIISLRLPEPRFSSQTKEKLVSQEARTAVTGCIGSALRDFLLENRQEAQKIITRVESSSKARLAARKARELVQRKGLMEGGGLPGKLADCQERDPKRAELFLVEGDSAGGSAKQARNRRNQAVLPLRGKILNVEKQSPIKMLQSETISSLITALGCGVDKDDLDPSKLRYHKIVLMTDADVDGAHIRTLLLTFFYRHMQELLKLGHIYIAQPPLFKIKHGKSEQYLHKEEDFANFVKALLVSEGSLEANNGEVYAKADLEQWLTAHKKYREDLLELEQSYPKNLLRFWLSEGYVPPGKDENSLNENAPNDYCTRANVFLENDELTLGKINGVFWLLERGQNVEQAENSAGYGAGYPPITNALLEGDKMRRMASYYNQHKTIWEDGFLVRYKSNEQRKQTLDEAYESMMDIVAQNINVQRYKGLGEMNPEQLWETSMDPEERHLLCITMEDAEEADKMFSILMGGDVEPRRNFIEENALKAINIDT